MGINDNTKISGDKLSPWSMPLLNLTVPTFCPLDVSSVFHFPKLLNTICIFSATLNIIIHFSTNYGEPCHMPSCSLYMSFPAQSAFPFQFLKIILSISNWSFVPLGFVCDPFCPSYNKLSRSRW